MNSWRFLFKFVSNEDFHFYDVKKVANCSGFCFYFDIVKAWNVFDLVHDLTTAGLGQIWDFMATIWGSTVFNDFYLLGINFIFDSNGPNLGGPQAVQKVLKIVTDAPL